MLDKKGIHPNLRPTKRNIVRQLNRLTRKAEPGDKFFFFYAGHGEQRKCHSDSESDGFDECTYLLPLLYACHPLNC